MRISRLKKIVPLLLLALALAGSFESRALADRAPSRPLAPPAAPAEAKTEAAPPPIQPQAPAAATAAAPATATADAEGFVPDSRPANMTSVDESIPAAPLVATAYGFIWLAVLGFVLFTLRRMRQLERELGELSERLDHGAPQKK